MAYDYTMDWSDGSLKPSFTLPGKTIDTTTTSLALTGKGTLNWGERLEENFLHLLEHFASNGTPPAHSTVGQLWYDNLAGKLNVRGDSAYQDVLQPVYDSLAAINTAPIIAGINALKHPRVIRQTFLGSGWYDFWGGVNMVNFNGQSPTKTGMVNSWIPSTNSIVAPSTTMPYISSIAAVSVTTFKVDQSCRLGLKMDAEIWLRPYQSLRGINWTYKIERSSDDGATWTFYPRPIASMLWTDCIDSAGNVIGYHSVSANGDVVADGPTSYATRTNDLVIPEVTPPDSGLTGHRIDISGADQGALVPDVPSLVPGYTYRFTVYTTVGVMNNTVQLAGLNTRMIISLLGE